MPPTTPSSESARDRLRRATASLDVAELTGSPFAMSHALAEVARCHRDLQAAASAEAYFEAAVRWARFSGSTDHVADLLCDLADVSVRVALERDLQALQPPEPAADGDEAPGRPTGGHAARERARDHAFEASQMASRVSDPAWEARLLLRVGEVLERCGDHADAQQMQLRALNRMGGVAPREAGHLSGFGRLADS